MKTPFLWGTATSSHQIEGENVNNDWWHWEKQGNIEGGIFSGKTADHWNRFKDDLRIASELGMTSYRFSIEWSRIEPEEGHWNQEAIAWYQELVAECERQGLVPMATLHHFTSPLWLAEKGGFTWEHSPGRFAGFVRKVIDALGSRIPLWCTVNEPMALVVGQYIGGFMPPAKYKPRLASIGSRNLLLAHVRAYDLLHKHIRERKGAFANYPLMVGIAHNMIDFRPLREWHPMERALAQMFRRFYNRSWPDAVTGRKQHFGALSLIPYAKQVWEARRRKTVDFIGINYYTKVYVCWGPQSQQASFARGANVPIGIVFSLSDDKTSDLGWAVHPAGLGRMIRFLKRYELPIFITENGIADREDRLRPEYLLSHVREIAKAIEEGADIRGYYHWSLMDNFEWIKGFEPRFGLFEVDYENFGRKARPSAFIYQRIISDYQKQSDGVPGSKMLNGLAHPPKI